MGKSKKIDGIERKTINEWKTKKDIKRLYESFKSMELTNEEKEELSLSDEFNALAYAYFCHWGN